MFTLTWSDAAQVLIFSHAVADDEHDARTTSECSAEHGDIAAAHSHERPSPLSHEQHGEELLGRRRKTASGGQLVVLDVVNSPVLQPNGALCFDSAHRFRVAAIRPVHESLCVQACSLPAETGRSTWAR